MAAATVVVGARNHKVGANTDQGSAYLYTRPAAGWGETKMDTQATELTAVGGAAGDQFGAAVAVSANTAFVGAPEHRVDLKRQGAAYVFVEPFGGWNPDASQTAELAASDGATGDFLGGTLAASGDSVLAGASVHEVGANLGQGAAYRFTKTGETWTNTRQTEELTASDGAAGDLFGISVGLSGDLAVVGALATLGDNPRQGATYVYDAPPSVIVTSPANGATYTQNSIIPAS